MTTDLWAFSNVLKKCYVNALHIFLDVPKTMTYCDEWHTCDTELYLKNISSHSIHLIPHKEMSCDRIWIKQCYYWSTNTALTSFCFIITLVTVNPSAPELNARVLKPRNFTKSSVFLFLHLNFGHALTTQSFWKSYVSYIYFYMHKYTVLGLKDTRMMNNG